MAIRKYGRSVRVTATTASQVAALPGGAGGLVEIYNSGTAPVFVLPGGASVVVAAIGATPGVGVIIPAGGVIELDASPHTHIAFLASTGTADLYLMQGDGVMVLRVGQPPSVAVRRGGSMVGTRRQLNFIGEGVAVVAADNAAADRVDVTLTAMPSDRFRIVSVAVPAPGSILPAGKLVKVACAGAALTDRAAFLGNGSVPLGINVGSPYVSAPNEIAFNVSSGLLTGLSAGAFSLDVLLIGAVS